MNRERSAACTVETVLETGPVPRPDAAPPEIPDYLRDTYSWAYLDEKSFWFFEHSWVVNLILWGNMRRLTRHVVDQVQLAPRGRVLQVACVYGEFSARLAEAVGQSGSTLDIVDVAPIQLDNARRKLANHRNVRVRHHDSSCLRYADASFDQTVVFFLLHEQPAEVRCRTVAEALRVTRPGGKVVFVDYHRPQAWNPVGWLMRPVLHWLEPFALDLWKAPLSNWFPGSQTPAPSRFHTFFGGLYQSLTVTR